MELLNFKREDLFKKTSMNSTQNIDFNEPLNEYEIYDQNAYENIIVR